LRLKKYDLSSVENILKDPYSIRNFGEQQHTEIVNILSDKGKMNLFFGSKSFTTDSNAPFFNTPYSLSENTFNITRNVTGMGLPPPNTLIPKDVSILPKDPEFADKPHLIKSDGPGNYELWYKKDDKFEQPKGIVQLKVLTDDLGYGKYPESPYRSIIFIQIWKNVVDQYIKEYTYMGVMADMKFVLEVKPTNIAFKWIGYSDTLETFV
jgi:secreted Zn-dependent insulinase-like peptidase